MQSEMPEERRVEKGRIFPSYVRVTSTFIITQSNDCQVLCTHFFPGDKN